VDPASFPRRAGVPHRVEVPHPDRVEPIFIDAGFSVESVFGDWDGRPADAASRELIFVAAAWAKFVEHPFHAVE
jgi:hypothetical protein